MASYQIPAPQPMNVKGDVSGNWKNFKASWDYYITATELNKKSPEVQAAALCSVMGIDCIHVMNSLASLSVADKKDPARILQELGDHFMPQKHLLFERVKFGYANQTEHETVDQYVVRLRQLADSCDFENLSDSLLRDRLVIGTHDSSTRDRLLRERPVPDLKRCIEALRASELSRAHKEQLRVAAVDSPSTVHAAHKQNHGSRYAQAKSEKNAGMAGGQKSNRIITCLYCGSKHVKDKFKCPAFGKICGKCSKGNHFASVCQQGQDGNKMRAKGTKKLHQLSDPRCSEDTSDDTDDSIFTVDRVGVVSSSKAKSSFMVPLNFHTEYPATLTVQLDTGASCSAMSYADLQNILQTGDVKLDPSSGKIRLYDSSIITPLGSYTLTVSQGGGHKFSVTFDILDQAPWPIIDANTCVKQGWISLGVDKSVNMIRDEGYDPLSQEKVMCDYDDVFTGLGCLPGEYHIEMDASIRPVQHAPRRVPVPLKSQLQDKINEMEKQGIIAKVTEPTDWISSLVAVQKPGKLRVCIDPKDLNKAIKRPKYQMPTVDEILPKLSNAKIFTVLDAKDGFYQVKLDEESSFLTTFWTPFGRYRYLRMPQGISSAPEEYQRRQNEALSGLDGVEVIADDILCFGTGETMDEALADHDRNLLNVLKRAREKNIKFNKKKLKLRMTQVPYMGQLLTCDGLKPDPSKVSAIVNMPPPGDKKAVQRLLGCVNYLSRFMPNVSKVCEPLRRLTEKQAEFMWESQQAEAFSILKDLISSTPVLKYYDVNSEVTIQCDSSESGLGATLLQNGQPVAFASRSLTETERRYAQIEKECLGILFSCVRFDQYLHGRDLITIQTDHKPLVPIFTKSIHTSPKRLQRMLLRLQKYNLHVTYLPGTQMFIADMLSRAYLPGGDTRKQDTPEYQIFQLSQEQQLFGEIAEIDQKEYMCLSAATHAQVQSCTLTDATLQTLMNTVMTGWPDSRQDVPVCIREYWNFRDELTAQDGVLYKGMKVVIPKSMQSQMIARAHTSHLGTDACVRRARDVLFWPGMAGEIEDCVKTCGTCNEFPAKQQKEPLMTHPIPKLPWSKVGQDLLTLHGESYLVTVDYYSDYFELDLVENTTSASIIVATKSHFARHGIADMVTDNGPQYISEEFSAFTREWEFNHTTTSPYHSQSNGKVESAVKIAKKLLKKTKRDNKDIQMALLEWRNTPDSTGSSPVQRLMSRRTKTTMPTAEALLKPQVIGGVTENITVRRQKAKLAYDKHAKPLPELEIGDPIRMQPLHSKSPWEQGSCVGKVGPRSYLVESRNGRLYRRNRKFLQFDNSQKKPSISQDGPPAELVRIPTESPMSVPPDVTTVTVSSDKPLGQSGNIRTFNDTEPLPPPSRPTTTSVRPTVTTRSGRHCVVPAKYNDYIVPK